MQIKKTFYRAFEDRHRGSRDLIKERLRAYLPFLEAFLTVYTPAETLDIGCGRGEWLELLTEFGFMPSGIDLDNGMLEACHALGLNAIQGDGIEHLRAMADESQVVISAFHVVEHIAFEQLQILAAEAHRVLKPGGLLIMETPNPENIIVATRNFYLDPTHIRPIPPDLLSFVAEYTGFARVKTLRLQESKELIKKESLNLQEVLSGASPDYAIVAQKEASHAVLKLTDDAFSREYGLSLENLLGRWDERVERISDKANHAEAQTEQVKEHIDSLMTQTFNVVAQAESAIAQSIHAIDRSNHAEAQATQASERANHAEAQSAQANERANHAEAQAAQANERANHAEAQANIINQQYQAVIHSHSWTLTKPLRLASKFVQWFVRGSIAWLTLKPGSRPRRMMRSALASSMAAVQSRPRLKRFAFRVLNRFPHLKQRLWNMRFQHTPVSQPFVTPMIHPHDAELSPRARQIYSDLKTAIEKQNKEGA